MGAFDRHAAAQLYAAHPVPSWLEPARRAASAEWLESSLPNRKTEGWKYTSLAGLAEAALLRAAPRDAPAPALEAVRIDGLAADYLVFVDGRYSAELSRVAPDSTWIHRFSEADAAQRALLEGLLGSAAAGAGNPFVALGGCWTTDGVLVHVPRGTRIPRPVCIVHAASGAGEPRAWAQRALVILEERAEGELIEYFARGPQVAALVAGSTEILLGQGARLAHRRLHLEAPATHHLGGVYVDLQRDAHYRGFVFAPGARIKRLDLRVRHQGQASEALLDGVYLAREAQHVDLHTTVEHAATHGTTHQVYRGLIDDEAQAVFNGRILIQPGAQKTSADLANRNLLFSDRAEVDFKPELEIYADDVKCSHGATVSRVEPRNLYYLQSRGIARREAEVLLAIGFVAELIGGLECTPLEALLRAELRAWFGLPPEEAA